MKGMGHCQIDTQVVIIKLWLINLKYLLNTNCLIKINFWLLTNTVIIYYIYYYCIGRIVTDKVHVVYVPLYIR